MQPIKRALISVFDKTGIIDFVRQLVEEFHIEILSTGGTASQLQKAGIPYIQVSDYTGSPEMFDGRVKTLHPRIHGGLLMRRDHPQDLVDAKKYGIEPIDLVVCNLYPFKDVISKAEISLAEAIEMIDIGGPTQIRAAAKSFPYVTVVIDPSDYPHIIQELHVNQGSIPDSTRMKLAQQVFTTMALYDALIANYLSLQYSKIYNLKEFESNLIHFPPILLKLYQQMQVCRYGENWEQKAAYYRDLDAQVGLHNMHQIHGKAISFNNWLDIDSCIQVLLDFQPEHGNHFICAILKHTTPNGVAVDYYSLLEATKHAFSTDPLSAFGGIWGFNHTITEEIARFIIEEQKIFIEVILAPDFEQNALKILQSKENLRLVEFGSLLSKRGELYTSPEIRSVLGGVLIQDYDSGPIIKSWSVKSLRNVTEKEKEALIFAYRVSKWAKSNSAVFVKEYISGIYTLGIGAGQQSRVHVVKLAAQKALEFGHDLNQSVMGTDSFFPFVDGLDAAADVGCKAIINPGGSIRDNDIIQRANERNIALIFCDKRVFRH